MDENTSNARQVEALMALAQLKRQAKSGANNFYWIAALSVVNSLIALFGGGVSFVIGLGLTQVIDGFAFLLAQDLPDATVLIKGIGLALSIGISALFALFGYLSGKGQRWAFIAGMVLYAGDALLLLFFQDWWGVGFHLFLLFGLFGGLQALRKLQSMLPQVSADIPFSKDVGYN
ncbi:MAG: hypothetical protein GXP40_01515 [Chloroflexi bacterium]|nr:hypothetical protein [Chloroflexota bacterium]